MRTRLFHTVVLVGTAMGASLSTVSCSSSDSGSQQCQGQSCNTFPGISFDGGGGDTHADTFKGIAIDTGNDTFPGIHPADIGVDTNPADTNAGDAADGGDADDSDTFPGIAIDTGTDTFPGISPILDTGTDTWPGISPPPPSDAA